MTRAGCLLADSDQEVDLLTLDTTERIGGDKAVLEITVETDQTLLPLNKETHHLITGETGEITQGLDRLIEKDLNTKLKKKDIEVAQVNVVKHTNDEYTVLDKLQQIA